MSKYPCMLAASHLEAELAALEADPAKKPSEDAAALIRPFDSINVALDVVRALRIAISYDFSGQLTLPGTLIARLAVVNGEPVRVALPFTHASEAERAVVDAALARLDLARVGEWHQVERGAFHAALVDPGLPDLEEMKTPRAKA